MTVTFSSDKDIELMMTLSKLAVSLSVMAFIISLIFLVKIVNLEKKLKGKLRYGANLERFSSSKTEFYIPSTQTKVPVSQFAQFHSQDNSHAPYQTSYQTSQQRTIAVPNLTRNNYVKKNGKPKDKYIAILLLVISLLLVSGVVITQLCEMFGMSNYSLYLWLIVGFVLLAIGTVSEELFLK
jgi:hypothetical protein